LQTVSRLELSQQASLSQQLKRDRGTLRSSLANEGVVKLYKSYIRPIIEYTNDVWNPYLRKDIKLLEGVQRSATKLNKELRTKP
jgi:hypothetical protein